MEAGATGDISIAVLRRQGIIGIPVWLWLGGAWVDFPSLTAAQFSTYVTARLDAIDNPNGAIRLADESVHGMKIDGLTISKVQF